MPVPEEAPPAPVIDSVEAPAAAPVPAPVAPAPEAVVSAAPQAPRVQVVNAPVLKAERPKRPLPLWKRLFMPRSTDSETGTKLKATATRNRPAQPAAKPVKEIVPVKTVAQPAVIAGAPKKISKDMPNDSALDQKKILAAKIQRKK